MPCWSGCFAGSAAVEAGGGVVAHGWQLQAAMLLFQAAEREVTALPLSSSVSFFFLFFRCQVVSLFVLPALLFVSLSNPPLFRTSQYSFLPLSISFPLFFILFVLSFFPPSLVLVLRAIFIGKRGVGASLSPPYCCAWGCRVSWLVGVAGRARLPRFLIMRRRGASGFGRARDRKE